ncbi:MAG: hypothetical protein ABIG61_06490 [Planctomycetota bacterium]
MKFLRSYPVKVFASGFIALVLFSIVLFWARWILQAILLADMGRQTVRIPVSRLVPDQIENDPNVVQHSLITAKTQPVEWLAMNLGITAGIRAAEDKFERQWFRSGEAEGSRRLSVYFDKTKGLLVYNIFFRQRIAGRLEWARQTLAYFGPNGGFTAPERNLGRFSDPVIGELQVIDESRVKFEWIVYDQKQRRFFRIIVGPEKEGIVVHKGPQLDKDDFHRPTQIGKLNKGKEGLSLSFSPPMVEYSLHTHTEAEQPGFFQRGRRKDTALKELIPALHSNYSSCDAGPYVLVLDEAGGIDLLDKQTLSFAGVAGRLPAAPTFFSETDEVVPKDLLAYNVLPLVITGEYRGLFAASVSRDATGLAVVIFDEKGRRIAGDFNHARNHDRALAAVIYEETTGGIAIAIGKYLLENLQPFVFGITSYFSGSSVEAGAGYRTLFILPNSFAGMFSREAGGTHYIARFFFALFLLSPSVILGIFLALRIAKSTAIVGLSSTAKLWWIVGAVCFGLVAYITYRLAGPREDLVTCLNCGKLRRCDMDKCHHCKSPWHVPHLEPPAWRVMAVRDQSSLQEAE